MSYIVGILWRMLVMEGHLLMSSRELRRKTVLDGVLERRMTRVEAAALLDLSYRQLTRVLKRYAAHGEAGLVHLSRGRSSNRGFPSVFWEQALALYEKDYAGYGPTLACEKLALKGYEMDAETLRRRLIAAGLWSRARESREHRRWRSPKEHFGELVQMDGSHHPWFGPEHPSCCLMVMVDDARGVTLAWMAEQETTVAAMELVRIWLQTYGIPKALYTDRKNVYVTERAPTPEEQLADQEPLTALGMACAKLDIGIIRAHSPQAKGRVERKNGVFQDRLVKELRLQGITTITGANELLYHGFLDSLNAKFAHNAHSEVDFHTPLPKRLDLAAVFCFEQTRSVQNDWTIRHENQRYQLEATNRPLPRPKEKVVVQTHLDGTLYMLYRDKRLTWTRITQSAPAAPSAKVTPASKVKAQKTRKPADDHPWRKPGAGLRKEGRQKRAPD
jgi:hypothetical protein